MLLHNLPREERNKMLDTLGRLLDAYDKNPNDAEWAKMIDFCTPPLDDYTYAIVELVGLYQKRPHKVRGIIASARFKETIGQDNQS